MLRHFTTLSLTLALSVVLLATLGPIPSVLAQPGTLPANQANVIAEEAAQAAAAQASPAQEPQAAPAQTAPSGSRSQSPGGESKPSEGSGKPSSDKANPESGEAGKTVQRENAPPAPPNPEELNARPNADGLLEFQFRNQPWPKLLSWLAEVSQQSLDWQELPGDYLNLATQRPYTVEETRDAINRHLLMRGFTLLESEGVLSVVKVSAINPSMVPRVSPAELANQMPHRFVRTSFELYFLMAGEVHEEFKSMLSPNGKITPLESTNRLEVMDCAANVRDIHLILEQEQSTQALEDLAREFPLKHARASYVKEQLEVFLGLKGSSSGSSSSSGSREAMEMVRQQMQQMQQMQQQMQQRGNEKSARPTREKAEVYLVANDRSNSVIVHAPQNKMAIIESFIARMDVPNSQAADFERVGIRMKVFRLASLAPSELAKSLMAMDVLEPATRLQVDDNNNAIIVYASIADQYMIQSVIDRLDGSQRSAHVIQLRRLDAEAVAGSIKFLMGADEENKDENRRYSYYDYSSSRSSKNTDKMRVGANVQDNQVLVWANAIEMEEVQGLLVKLGELPPQGGKPSTVRVIDASRQPETYEYLKRLKEQWEKISPNPLVIPGEVEFVEPTEEGKDKAKPPKSANPSVKSNEITQSKLQDAAPDTVADRLVSKTAQDTSQPAASQPAASQQDNAQPVDAQQTTTAQERPVAPPVTIMVDESGQLIIQSTDTAALDRLEQIMQVNKPPKKPYDVFVVKYARATWVKLNLDEYFEKEENNERRDRFLSWAFDLPFKKEGPQLGKKAELRFIADNDTNSIVAIGADDFHRQTIKELIELWDVPDPVNGKDVRYTKLVRIKFSSATSIVATIKEAYRDLLSSNDSAFQNNAGGKGNAESKRNASFETVQADGGLSSNFKGELSLGADAITNSVLVSARGEPLLELVVDMINELDKAAQPEGNVEVLQLSPGMATGSLGKALRAMLEKQQRNPQGKPTGPPVGPRGEQANPQGNNQNE